MLLVFDWDGTLSDSAARIVQCMQRAAEDLKLAPLSDETVKNIIGLGLPEAIRTLYPEVYADLNDPALEQFRARYAHHYVAVDQTPAPLFPNVLETLHRLRDDGYRLTVATGKSRKGLDRVLRSLDLHGFFHASRCADETASKPDPRMLHELLAEVGFPAERAVMIGDTEYDMDMARRAQVPRIGVSYGAHHVSRLHPYEPLVCLDHFADLLEWV